MNVAGADAPPPGSGLVTVTDAVPALLSNDRGTVTVSVVDVLPVTERDVVAVPFFQLTVEALLNPVPVITTEI